MTQTRQQQAIFPDLPTDNKIIEPGGNISDAWRLFFDRLIQALQTNFKPEGIVAPQQTASNIALLGDISAAVGNILYDSTNNEFKGILLVTAGPPVVTVTKTFTLT